MNKEIGVVIATIIGIPLITLGVCEFIQKAAPSSNICDSLMNALKLLEWFDEFKLIIAVIIVIGSAAFIGLWWLNGNSGNSGGL